MATRIKRARMMYQRMAKRLNYLEAASPSREYTPAEAARLARGKSADPILQNDHFPEIQDNPEVALDPAHLRHTTGGEKGALPAGSVHYQDTQENRRARLTERTSRGVEGRATEAPLESTAGPEPGTGAMRMLGSMNEALNVALPVIDLLTAGAKLDEMHRRRDETGYVPYGPDPDASWPERVAEAIVKGPLADQFIPVGDRLNFPVWRRRFRALANATPPGKPFVVSFDMPVGEWVSGVPVMRTFRATYKKQTNGVWQWFMEGTDDYQPPAKFRDRARGAPWPPSLNIIIDPKRSDEEVMRYLGISFTDPSEA
jgi:hypothetical protein